MHPPQSHMANRQVGEAHSSYDESAEARCGLFNGAGYDTENGIDWPLLFLEQNRPVILIRGIRRGPRGSVDVRQIDLFSGHRAKPVRLILSRSELYRHRSAFG